MMHKKDYYISGAASSTNISYYHNKQQQSNEMAIVPFMNSKINENSHHVLKRPESSSQFFSILHHQGN
jgi:hypothetical protein